MAFDDIHYLESGVMIPEENYIAFEGAAAQILAKLRA
jgi:hypothetical protein